MMYGDPQPPPPPVQHPPPLPPQQHHQQFQYQPRMGDFPMGQQQQQQPPLPPPMMRQPSALSATLGAPQDYNYPSAQPPHPSYNAQADSFSANRMRKMGQRRTVDYTSTVVRYMQIRMYQRDSRDKTILQPTPAAAIDMLPTVAYSDNASVNFAAKFVHTSINKNRCSINRVLWTPTGRRLITGSQSGELTLWNGQAFNFEMVLQAHDQPIRSMVWSYNDNWMVTGDDGGTIKYWQNNMNNVKVNKSGHNESVRDLSFCRTDLKFCSCSDDGTVKVWDFARCAEDRSLSGHGWNVMSVDWHPTKSLMVSGGKDNLVKLWDAKSGKELHSFVGHKNNVLNVKWNQNGNWVLSASKDQIIKLYDIRSMKELQSFHGHHKDVTALAWHPFQEEYFVSGSLDGSIFHWLVGHDNPQVEIPNAHDNIVWNLSWHPIGYLLCSGSNDQTTKFWCRNRPGDQARDNFNLSHNRGGYGEQNLPLAGNFSGSEPPTTIPGTFGGGLSRNEGTIPGIGVAMQLDTSVQGEQKPPAMIGIPSGGLPPPLPPGPHPSLFAGANQQQAAYQQNVQQQHHQIHHQQQQMTSLPRPPPPNFQQLQTPPQFPLHPPHLPRPPAQLPPMPMQGGPIGMRGTMNHQMVPPMPQAHFMNMNHNVQSGSPGGIPNVMQNMQGPPNGSVNQMYSVGGGFNRPQSGQMPAMPGNAAVNSSMGTLPPPSFGMHPPLPPGPPPRGQTPQ